PEVPPEGVGVAFAEAPEVVLDLSPPAPGRDDAIDLLLGRRAGPHPDAVVGQDVQPRHVVRRAAAVAVEAGLQGMHAAGVGGDVAADRAIRVRCGIGAEPQAVGGGGLVDAVVERPRLDPYPPPGDVELEDAVEVAPA